MKRYMRIMLGKKSVHAEECQKGGFIGADFDMDQDLTGQLPEDWREFNKKFIPVYLGKNPGKHKIAAGLACGTLWTIAKGINKGDTILSPNGRNEYLVGVVTGDYQYHPEGILPHRRQVEWLPIVVERSAMSEALKNSTGSIGTSSDISQYAAELDRLIGGQAQPTIVSTDETVEDASVFALEKHLEHFLVENWKYTILAKDYDIYTDEEEGFTGQQFKTDTGAIDILAISKDKKTLLVLELKKGRASDVVVGQIMRYIGDIKEEVAEPDQKVRGLIIGLEDDRRIRRALHGVDHIDFYQYKVRFELIKA